MFARSRSVVLLITAVMAQGVPFCNVVQRAVALEPHSADPAAIGDRSGEQSWLAQLRKLGAQEVARGWLIPLTTAEYPSGVAGFHPSSVATVDVAAGLLRQYPGAKVLVEGHSDSRGSGIVNNNLSLARAEAVCGYFRQHGVDAGRLQAVGVADREPIASNATSVGRAQNRRVDIVFSDVKGRFGRTAESHPITRVIRPIYGHHPLNRRLPLGVEGH